MFPEYSIVEHDPRSNRSIIVWDDNLIESLCKSYGIELYLNTLKTLKKLRHGYKRPKLPKRSAGYKNK